MSLEEERADVDRQIIRHEAEAQRCEEAIKEMEMRFRGATQKSEARSAVLGRLKSDLERARGRLDSLATEYAAASPLETQARALQEEIARLRTEHWKANDALQREMGAAGGTTGRSFDLEYDRRACAGIEQHICGRVAELVLPQDDKYAVALMVGAQMHLMRVVVTSDIVAEKLIRHGLRQRTAFLPLNTLQQPKGIDVSRLEEAKRIASRTGEFIALARDLTTVKNETFRVIADVVYGNFLVCSSLELAQELAYNPAVRCKAVSLQGEIAEPKGVMTGGSTQQLRNIFDEIRAYQKSKAPVVALREKIDQLEVEYELLQERLRQYAPLVEQYKAAEEAVGLAAHKLQLAEGEGDGALSELRASIEERRLKCDAELEMVRELKKKKSELERRKAQDPRTTLKELQKQLADAQKRYAALSHEEETGASEFERIEAEMTQAAADLEQKLTDVKEEIEQQKVERDRVLEQFNKTSATLKDVVQRRCATEDQRLRLEKEIEEVQEELQQLVVRKSSLETLIKNAEVEMRDSAKMVADLQKAVSDTEKRHTWIPQERHLFGKAGGPFNFSDKALTERILQELREAEAQTAAMSKRLNKKALILYEERKKEYDELTKQCAALGEDRDAIQQCILGIEEKKWQALDRMVEVVSGVFSKLFSTCLPGASAALREERNEQQHLRGLQVKVTFNGKERESLSELSGGQRSLLALCLILAILRVRQAPMYILDEVDAALDPSHTQSIGKMLQTHFPTSQFLLVSLKDGMYSNADVLYQVSNTQGYSEITRVETGTRGR
ncbi:SMC proteins Flexible Hinge Domain RecF RecN SMC N terminal domain [Trypanosoma vivax]|nr:SMC proteins Flexible Hinge Domain RecF RecN SMC N terminal domain [Trypanosoma vivax]